jgi:hypothetical protein
MSDPERTNPNSEDQKELFLRTLDEALALIHENPDITQKFSGITEYSALTALSTRAQQVDLVIGSSFSAKFGGNHESLHALQVESALRLRTAIDEYSGPEEIRQLYQSRYELIINKILGE